MKGTIVNTITVLLGSALGLLIGNKFPERVKHIVIQSIGLFTILIGITMITKSTKFIVDFISLILGSITGELLHLEDGLNILMEKIKKRVSPDSPHFVEGFYYRTLVFVLVQ